MTDLWNRDNYSEELKRILKLGQLWTLRNFRKRLIKADSIDEQLFILTEELKTRFAKYPYILTGCKLKRQITIIKSIRKVYNLLSEMKINIQKQDERDETEVFRYYGLN